MMSSKGMAFEDLPGSFFLAHLSRTVKMQKCRDRLNRLFDVEPENHGTLPPSGKIRNITSVSLIDCIPRVTNTKRAKLTFANRITGQPIGSTVAGSRRAP